MVHFLLNMLSTIIMANNMFSIMIIVTSGYWLFRDRKGAAGMEDPETIQARVTHFIALLHANIHEKELVTKRLLDLAKSRREARAAIGFHSRAIPSIVALLKSGTTTTKVNAALTLECLCAEEDLRVKVLQGECIHPLFALLRSGAAEAQKAAAKAIYAVSLGGVADHVPMNIFLKEGLVPILWDQLHTKCKQEQIAEDLLRALKNLSTNTEGFLQTTLEAGGVDILVRLISTGSTVARSNACFLLAKLMLVSEARTCTEVLNSGAVQHLLKLLGPENEVSVRAEAASALQTLSSKLTNNAKKAIEDEGGVPILITSVVAPSKVLMQGLPAQALQERAMGTLVNILGGVSGTVLSLVSESTKPSRSDIQVADIVGALAYALMVLNGNSDAANSLDAVNIEGQIFRQLKPCNSQLVHERVIEALASLYGNAYLCTSLRHAKVKKMLVGLVTMATSEVQEHLMQLLINLCSANSDLWQSFRGPEGIKLLISFLGLSCEQQEHAVALLLILSMEVDDTKRTIAEAGGVPPLVQLLENGSWKAKEDASILVGNLCAQSEEIRACVESADAVPALLSLLGKDSLRGQESAAKALKHLIRDADAATLDQLLDLLLENEPMSKVHVIMVLGSVLSVASHEDLVQEGSATNNALQSLVRMLHFSVQEIDRYFSAQALASLVSNGSRATVLAVANSGAAGGLIQLLGSGEPDISYLTEVTEAFPLIRNPSHVVLESLFRVDDMRLGATVRQSIPSLVDLLNPMPDKPGAPPLALDLLTQIASGNNADKVAIVEAGALIGLFKLLGSHQCCKEADAAGLLEAIFNNMEVQEMEVFKSAISPLLQFILDPQTRVQRVRLLATHILGDLFQHDGLARTTDALSACRALVRLLKDQPPEEITMAAIRALQNLVMYSRTNRSAVAEEGGILVLQNLLSSNNLEITVKAALLITKIISDHTLQEYVSSEVIRALTAINNFDILYDSPVLASDPFEAPVAKTGEAINNAAMDKEFWVTATLNEEVVKAINILLKNPSTLLDTETSTYCIRHLVGALKSATEPAQEVALEALLLLKDSWGSIPVASAEVQTMVAGKAIPILQSLINSGPHHFYEKAESLLQRLPGILTVTVIRGPNLKRCMGSTNVFCELTFGNGPPRETKVVSHSSSPEWNQGFAWAFDTPPIGKKLHISCMSEHELHICCMGKITFGEGSLGEATIQIDKAVLFGTITGEYTLIHDAKNDDTCRTLELEFRWSNR